MRIPVRTKGSSLATLDLLAPGVLGYAMDEGGRSVRLEEAMKPKIKRQVTDELAADEEAIRAATLGPWTVSEPRSGDGLHGTSAVVAGERIVAVLDLHGDSRERADAAFICRSRRRMPELVTLVRALLAERDKLRAEEPPRKTQ